MAEVYEVATFYAHFDVVADGEQRPPKVTVRVCDSLSCMLAGAESLLSDAAGREDAGVRVRACALHRLVPHGACRRGRSSPRRSRDAGQAERDRAARPRACRTCRPIRIFDAYVKAGGYAVLRSCLSGARKVEDVIAALSDGGLRGLGGAGFPTGRKWGLVRAEKGPRLMAVNGDEGEPGTFKDRIYLEKRAAQVSRRHADRGVGGGGRAGLHLHARRISRRAEDPEERDRQAGGGRPRQAHQGCTSAAAPAPTSAAKRAR